MDNWTKFWNLYSNIWKMQRLTTCTDIRLGFYRGAKLNTFHNRWLFRWTCWSERHMPNIRVEVNDTRWRYVLKWMTHAEHTCWSERHTLKIRVEGNDTCRTYVLKRTTHAKYTCWSQRHMPNIRVEGNDTCQKSCCTQFFKISSLCECLLWQALHAFSAQGP